MNLRRQIRLAFVCAIAILIACFPLLAQSTNQDHPTPVTTTEINGSIKARDVGDARLTSYYYQFDGDQGDLFINVVTRNFTGDIDLFTLNGLRPLTKIVMYADFAENETGRVIYLRKPEKMILRVQGRTPGDEPAMFRIKFAGSFVASTMQAPPGEPELPTLTAKNESGIRVNSVGTIVEVIPKATPTPAPSEIAGNVDERSDVPQTERVPEKPQETPDVAKADEKKTEPGETPEKKVAVVITDTLPESKEITPTPARRPTRGRRRTPPKTTPPTETTEKPLETGKAPPKPTVTRTRRGKPPAKPAEPPPPDPLEKVNLVILFKDGARIERPMSEVLRFTVDKGILTVISKDGSIGRYSILDVLRVTIE